MEVGATLLSLSYLPCVIVGAMSDDAEALPLVLPIAGPLIAGATLGVEDWAWYVLGGFAGMQAVGAGVFAFGVLLAVESGGRRPGAPARKATLDVTPVAGPGTGGLSIRGVF